jgi:signal transduction histidine kinase
LQYEETTLNKLIDETLEFATDRLELKQIQLVKDYGPDSRIVVDIQKMKIAFLNIIVNAIEAMEQGKGILTIKTGRTGDKCMVSFSDNGVGMTEEALQKLFEPYFTNKSKGAGLGLTNTQNIILNHKGSIQVASEYRQGSTFTITLNVA